MGGMLRRWVIRMPFLLALACVLSVWVASYFGVLVAGKTSAGQYQFISAVGGSGDICKFRGPYSTSAPDFRFIHGAKVQDWSLPPTTLGFYCGSPATFNGLEIIFPLWLPAVVLVGLNWFVWRKTRAQIVGRAFPVEVQGEGR